jgi:SAM-dependent methyltransferase
MVQAPDPRLFYPAVARNREPILEVLRRVLPAAGLVLEVASGSGEHAVSFAQELPALLWQPTDLNPEALASISAHRSVASASNLLAPLYLDVMSPQWPIDHAEALVCINMIHISPWAATERLMAGAEHILGNGGVVYLYGPYRAGNRHTAQSNEDFDARLRSQNAEWGVRDLEEVETLAQKHGLKLEETISMPANNLSVVLRKSP